MMGIAASTGKSIFLGTALWGWGTNRANAFELLDRFYETGGRNIDAASNYPINKDPSAFGMSNRIISDWLRANGVDDVSVYCKIGSVDNMGGPENNLSPAAILAAVELCKSAFFDNLSIIGVHWDNRSDARQIADTVDVFKSLKQDSFRLGLSGIKHPDVYAQVAQDLAADFYIQIKENAQTDAARRHYKPHFPNATYLAYGINMGGVKSASKDSLTKSSLELRNLTEPPIAEKLRNFLDSDHALEPRPQDLNELAIYLTLANPEIDGLIIGPRNIEQLSGTLRFLESLNPESLGPDSQRLLTQITER